MVVIGDGFDVAKLAGSLRKKQKIVLKVQMHCEKCRAKALTVAADADGVSFMGLEGEDKDKVVVIGDGVDSATLASRLRRKQVIVFKVQMNCGKSRVKARTVVAKAFGVNSLALQGDDRIVVSGDDIDAASLTFCLRKKVGHTDIISIMPIDP
ncbi:unnamed protein product [Dovyalis caffra]|uniref:HMA domain-containing protein n=1 Tax=Dovyalis caffra TaxID=77055 RepID=A0AAV1QNU1_9ROSI|nr:unnamed protein product [Dovyalis caffra]